MMSKRIISAFGIPKTFKGQRLEFFIEDNVEVSKEMVQLTLGLTHDIYIIGLHREYGDDEILLITSNACGLFHYTKCKLGNVPNKLSYEIYYETTPEVNVVINCIQSALFNTNALYQDMWYNLSDSDVARMVPTKVVFNRKMFRQKR